MIEKEQFGSSRQSWSLLRTNKPPGAAHRVRSKSGLTQTTRRSAGRASSRPAAGVFSLGELPGAPRARGGLIYLVPFTRLGRGVLPILPSVGPSRGGRTKKGDA